MELSGITLGRRRRAVLDALLEAAQGASPSYDHIGSTLGAAPSSTPDRRHAIDVDGDLARAAAALRGWRAHGGIDARIHPADAPIEEGTTLLVVAPFGPFEMVAPDRIVAVIDERDRFGFAYGTLPGHPEVGEELFLAEQLAPGRLRLTIRIHAGPATVLARIGTPIVMTFQRAAARRYLAAWAASIEEDT